MVLKKTRDFTVLTMLRGAFAAVIVGCASATLVAPSSPSFNIANDQFMKDGKPFQIKVHTSFSSFSLPYKRMYSIVYYRRETRRCSVHHEPPTESRAQSAILTPSPQHMSSLFFSPFFSQGRLYARHPMLLDCHHHHRSS